MAVGADPKIVKMAHGSGGGGSRPFILDLGTLSTELEKALFAYLPAKAFWGDPPAYNTVEIQKALDSFREGAESLSPKPAPSEVLFTVGEIKKKITAAKKWPYHMTLLGAQTSRMMSLYEAHFKEPIPAFKPENIIALESLYAGIIQEGRRRQYTSTKSGTYAVLPIHSAPDFDRYLCSITTDAIALVNIRKNLESFIKFFTAETTIASECQRALTYLQSNESIQSLANENGYKTFLIQNATAFYNMLLPAAAIVAPEAAIADTPSVSMIEGISAGNWYHNKASDRDMQLSQLWDEVIRYSTGRTADAERQRMLSMGAAEALNRLAADPSADVPENFASLLRGVITSLDAKSAGAGAMDKAEAVKGIVIDRKGEAVADDHPELRARLNALSEADLHNVCRNLRRVQQDLLEENTSHPFRQAFTRAYLALPTSIEKLTRVNGYERYKVRESKAWEQYRAYYTLLGQPEPRDVTSPFFTPLSQLETGSLLEQDGTLRQLEENLRQFTAFCQKETTPEDQRQFVREYLQTQPVVAHLASKSSFAHFQAALRARPSAPPKSAMRNEPAAAAVFAPSAPMAASAPPLPVANEIPPLQASLAATRCASACAARGGRGDQINAAQGAFLIADALNMPIAPSGGLSAASAPPLPTALKKEAVKEPVLG